MLRQSVFGRLAGYEDVNDASRLRHDPAMRWIVGGKAAKVRAASPSQMGRFETRWLAAPENLCTRPVCRVSDGGGRDPAQVVRRDRRENRCLAIAALGNGNMNARPPSVREIRREICAHLVLHRACRDRARRCGASRREKPATRPAERPETARNHPAPTKKRTVIWGMPA